ncbi:hypothetical protein MCUN1_002363 [Malassezia cuniculi]|uniref:RRM domain-containing protein n=1 Tax=Malassezia cuniculi TaxID=948313 RepID=A0AAF0J6W7_9BASI|nr:hypothetical protein MCUN1_002363 [Malassezia cuniculi]
MSNEADDLYADLYGDDAAPVAPAAAPAPAATADPRAAPAAAPAAPSAPPAQSSFIPSMPGAASVSPAEARALAAVRGEHIAPQDLPDEGKMFVGGLNWDTTEDSLRRYFGQFGPVSSCTVMRDGSTGRSRGFAFVTFVDPKSVNAVMVREHFLDGKIIDPKRAIPRPEQSKTQKCFVGGLPQSVTQDSFKRLFQQFGHVLDSTVMMDKDTGRPRGFGFVTFENDDGVERTLANQPLMLDGKQIEVKRAQSRGQAPVSAQPNRFSAPEPRGPTQLRMWGGAAPPAASAAPAAAPQTAGSGATAAAGGFDPQAMAKMYQQMGWGSSAWNPQLVWQQMMTAYMSGAAKNGGGWGGANQPRAQGGGASPRDDASPAGGSGWNTRGGAGTPPADPRGRGSSRESSYQRERSPVRGSHSYEDRQRY